MYDPSFIQDSASFYRYKGFKFDFFISVYFSLCILHIASSKGIQYIFNLAKAFRVTLFANQLLTNKNVEQADLTKTFCQQCRYVDMRLHPVRPLLFYCQTLISSSFSPRQQNWSQVISWYVMLMRMKSRSADF